MTSLSSLSSSESSLFSYGSKKQEHQHEDMSSTTASSSVEAEEGRSCSFGRGRGDTVVDLTNNNNDISAGADDDDESSAHSFIPSNVWGFDKVNKLLGGPNGTVQLWECGWCGAKFKGWNATKALSHITKTRGKDIKVCTAFIPKECISLYKSLRDQRTNRLVARAQGAEAVEYNLNETQQSMAVMLESTKKRKSHSMGEISQDDIDPSQPGTVTATMSAQLTVAIVDFVHPKGLPFSICEGPAFDRILKFAKTVPSTYKKPSRKAISDDLLVASYKRTRMNTTYAQLDKEASVFGLSISGDGVTVKKAPLINILATGVHQPAAVLDIHDCTAHMVNGGKKDAEYITKITKPHLSKIDLNKEKVDVIFFDGASNVQLGGRVLEAHNPRLTLLHGAEHVMSLFFADLAKLWPIKIIINHYRRLYRLFGSGSMHSPYAMFSAQAKTFNKGRSIGLIRAADTRMAGNFYALHRMLRLKHPLLATIASAPYKSLKLQPWTKKVEEFLLDKTMWTAVYAILRACFPLLRVLRLADKASPGTMDKLNYFVGRTTDCIEKSCSTVDLLEYFGDKSIANSSDITGIDPNAKDDDDVYNDGHDDIESSLVDDDDDDDDESVVSSASPTMGQEEDIFLLGHEFQRIWLKRKKKLESDFAVTACFLCPCPEIRTDVAGRHTADDRDAVDRILTKLFYPTDGDALANIIAKFWSEWHDFSSKTGRFAQEYIWRAAEIGKGLSYLWHQQYSLIYTTFLGFVACQVCSKTLGIGSCERSWSVVKQLK